jgi:hypothetical protein
MKFLLPVCLSIAVLTAGNSVQAQDDPVSHGQALIQLKWLRCRSALERLLRQGGRAF